MVENIPRIALFVVRNVGRTLLGRPARSPMSLRVREDAPGELPRDHAVPGAGCLHQRVLCVAEATAVGAGVQRRPPDTADPQDPRTLAGHLQGTAHPRRTGRSRDPRRAQASSSLDANRCSARGRPTQSPPHHPQTARRPASGQIDNRF